MSAEENSPLLGQGGAAPATASTGKGGGGVGLLPGPNPYLVDVSPDTQGPIIKPHCLKGWCSVLAVFIILTLAMFLLAAMFFVRILDRGYIFQLGTLNWWILTGICHIPYYLILFFLVLGFIERLGFVMIDCNGDPDVKKHTKIPQGRDTPHCCVQLAMYNEHEVCERIIEAACCIDWPREKFEVQVLDDSTDKEVARRVDACADRMRTQWGINCYVRRRVNRKGYKAGALEEGRKETTAEFLVLFDADFVPTKSYLRKAIPHFYDNEGTTPVSDLALVQCQWGHLNPFASGLTMSQSLWIDDHHTVQMAWRSRIWNFVNFTGTAGVWRASAIEAAGGWRSASLVEDCELSFRVLFTGFRTKFVNSIVQPAELPDSVTAYKAQQKRWTQGWVQLWRMHFYHLLFVYKCTLIKRVALVYHMLIVWQWPIWTSWFFMFPFMVWFGCWFGELEEQNTLNGWMLFYTIPMLSWLVTMTILAAFKTKHTYPDPLSIWNFLPRTLGRLIPYMILNSGMLPHQLCSFMDGYLEDLHAEFERTPKKGDPSSKNGEWESYVKGGAAANAKAKAPELRRNDSDGVSLKDVENAALALATDKLGTPVKGQGDDSVLGSPGVSAASPLPPQKIKNSQAKIHWYVYAEIAFVVYQLFWIDLYIRYGEYFAACFGIYQATCMLILLAAYGDDRDGDLYSFMDRSFKYWCCCCCCCPQRKDHPV